MSVCQLIMTAFTRLDRLMIQSFPLSREHIHTFIRKEKLSDPYVEMEQEFQSVNIPK